MGSPKIANGDTEATRSSSPLSPIHEPELPDASDAQLPPVENIELSSPAGSKESSTAPKPQSPKSPKKRKRLVVKRAPKKSKWDAASLLGDPKSPLASAELRTLLTNPMAWDVLDQEEKAEILALFPDNQHILKADTQDARPDFASLRNDDSFRYDCAAYTEHLAQGRHDPEWLEMAWSAHQRRRIGDFDEYLETKFNEDWDVELPPEMKSSRVRLVTKESDVNTEDTEMKQASNGSDKNDQDETMGDHPDEIKKEENGLIRKDEDDHSKEQPQTVANPTIDNKKEEDEIMDEPPKPVAEEADKQHKRVQDQEDQVTDEITVADVEMKEKDLGRKTTTVCRPRRNTKRVIYAESDSSEDELA